MVLSGFGDFRICAPGTRGGGGGLDGVRSAPIHGGGGEFWGRSDPRSMEYLVPNMKSELHAQLKAVTRLSFCSQWIFTVGLLLALCLHQPE